MGERERVILELLYEAEVCPERFFKQIGYEYSTLRKLINRMVKEELVEKIVMRNYEYEAINCLRITRKGCKKIGKSALRSLPKDMIDRFTRLRYGCLHVWLHKVRHRNISGFENKNIISLKNTDKVRGSRAHAYFGNGTNSIILYNAYEPFRFLTKRNVEERFVVQCESELKEKVLCRVVTAKTEQFLANALKEDEEVKVNNGSSLIMLKDRPLYFVSLNERGRTDLYLIMQNANDRILNYLLAEGYLKEEKKSPYLVFHARAGDNKLVYVGTNYDVGLLRLLHDYDSVCKSPYYIYCFQHQAAFYKENFKNAIIREFDINKVSERLGFEL